MFSHVSSRELFATPFLVARLPEADIAAINAELEPAILAKEKQSSGVKFSNSGGWQSDASILEWGGRSIQRVISSTTELLNQITLYLDKNQYSRVNIQWRVHGWANINRKGHHNVMHTHPGAYWSAVYYVHVPEQTSEMSHGGDLEMLDPRGTLPIMYCPVLRFGIKGLTSAGTSELHKPKTGDLVIFPSWLPHAVTPYIGEEMRISIALNFSV